MQRISEEAYFIPGRGADSNSILVVSDTVFLVDTGTGQNIGRLKKELGEFKPEAIVNTHCHFDHVGGNQFFNAPAYIHKNDLPHLASGDPAHCAAAFFSSQLPKSNPLPLGTEFHGWRVLHTPGHTRGSICLLKNGVLISGDTLFSDGYGRTDLPGGDDAAMQHSLSMLGKLDYHTLLPGHGPAEK